MCPRDPGHAGEMALRADAVAPLRVELRRIDDLRRSAMPARRHLRYVPLPRSVAALATYATLPERRRAEAVLGAGHRLQPAGVALQALRAHGPREMNGRVLLEARRDSPFP